MYGIKKISDLTGIPPITLRAWENRYGVIEPNRTAGGTRVYTEDNLKDLLWVIDQKESKQLSIKYAMELLRERKKIEAKEKLNPSQYPWFADKIFELLKKHRVKEASDYVDFLIEASDHETTFHEILTPVLFRIGEEWEQGNVSVAQEHFMSHFIQQHIASAFYSYQVHNPNETAVAICPANEMHQIGLLLFSLFLKNKNIEVLFIGENTPHSAVIDLLNKQKVNLVALSFTMEEHVSALIELIDAIKTHDPDLYLVVGGRLVNKLDPPYKEATIGNDLKSWKQWFDTYQKQ